MQVCDQLRKVVHNHPEYARTAVDGLLTAGRFCAAGEEYELAMQIFREVGQLHIGSVTFSKMFNRTTVCFCLIFLGGWRHDMQSQKIWRDRANRTYVSWSSVFYSVFSEISCDQRQPFFICCRSNFQSHPPNADSLPKLCCENFFGLSILFRLLLPCYLQLGKTY